MFLLYGGPQSTRAEPGPMGRNSRRVDFDLLEELSTVKAVQVAVLGSGHLHVETRELPDKDVVDNIPSL